MKEIIESNAVLNLEEYRQSKTILESYPQYLMVELTRSCNLKCPMCRESNGPFTGHRMSADIFDKIEDDLFDKAKMIDLRGWGESLILDNIVSLIRRTAKKGAVIRFVTNLSFSRNDVLEVLAEHNCKVDVSLDSVDEAVLPLLRTGSKLKVISNNLGILSRRYKELYGSTDQITLLTTVQYPALSRIHELVPFAASFDIREIKMFPVGVKDDSSLSLTGKKVEVDAALQKVKALSKQLGVNVFLGARMGSLPVNETQLPACIHPWAYAYIAYNGKVGFCDHLIGPDSDDILMGDLNTHSFKEIWNGSQWQELRKNHVGNRDGSVHNFEHCSWCYRNKYVDFEEIFDRSLLQSKVPV